LDRLKELDAQGQLPATATLLELATGHKISASKLLCPPPKYAWNDPDAQRLPAWRIVLAAVRYPFSIVIRPHFGFYQWSEDDQFVLMEYCGVWGKVYVAVLWVIGILVIALVVRERFGGSSTGK
jgi:hypothetical protein